MPQKSWRLRSYRDHRVFIVILSRGDEHDKNETALSQYSVQVCAMHIWRHVCAVAELAQS